MTTIISNTRNFIVTGKLECEFTPEQSTLLNTTSGFTLELWHKSPMEAIFLGRSITNDEGNFSVSFSSNGKPSYLNNGEIIDVFMKVYYQGVLISGNNPYTGGRVTTSTRPIKNLVIREGVTDLGTLHIDVTPFEFPVIGNFTDYNPNTPSLNWDFLLGITYSTGEPLPIGYKFDYQIGLNATAKTSFTGSVVSSKEGFVKLPIPAQPILPKPTTGEFVIHLLLLGVPNDRSKQCYIEVTDGVDDYYTLITDLVIHDDFLCVFDGDSTYYKLADDIDLTAYSDALYITEDGEIFGFLEANGRFTSHGKITFNQIEFPEELDEISDGFYETNGNTGTVTSGNLGVETFLGITATILNSAPFFFDLHISIYEPEKQKPIYASTFQNQNLGSKNLIRITIDGSPSTLPDDTPNLGDIETVASITFSTTLKTFLETGFLTTLHSLKGAGPISYIEGFPTSGLEPGEVELLQGHVDLYTVNEDIEENQYLIDRGYNNLFDIASTPKSEFLNQVGDQLPFYKAVQIHEVIKQNQKFITNLLAARMSDYELADRVFPNLDVSEFAQKEFASMVNKCECDDCKSGISPFAYFVDLVKYGARHIRKTGTGAYSPVNYASFLSLLENYFIQPFGSLSVDCQTLHDQFCRVRLVTEVLEKYVDQQSLPQPVLDKLADDRRKFLLLTYQTLLKQAGTSYEELRDIVKTQPLSERIVKAEKWAARLGIPLEVPGDAELTAERIWLTFDNSDPDYELNAENLELIFGFRDTQRDVLTNPLTSFIDEWKQVHLKDLWRKADYPFTSYSREHVNPTDNDTFKQNWLPLIDPDIIGRGDLTYLSLDFAKELLVHRKAETDSFLNYYITDNNLVEKTSVDMNNRILRVKERDISTHKIEENEIFIEDSGSVFQPFNVLNRSLVGLDTDVILKKSTPEEPQDPIFQPNGTEPVMQYMRIVEVDVSNVVFSAGVPDEIKITFDSPVIQDVFDNNKAKFVSTDSEGVSEFYGESGTTGADWPISAIDYNDDNEVVLYVTDEPSPTFLSGTLTFVYEVEVPLFTTLVPNPVEICDELFTVDQTYDYLSPTPSGETNPFEYKVWDDPSSWPSGIGSGLSRYGKLKALFQIVLSGNATEEYQAIITNNLYLSTPSFIKMMEIFIMCENYLNSMFTVQSPTTADLYELTSVFRNSSKHELREIWIKEEIKHDPAGGTDYIKLMLDGKYFWKALTEPQSGEWDPTLQTIPLNAVDINKSHIPIIDPELLKIEDLLTSPDTKPYRDLYFDRKDELTTQRDDYFSWLVPFNEDGFEEILNHINTGDENTLYSLPDYNSLEDLIKDFESTNAFLIHKAETNLWEAFGLSGEDFAVVLPIKQAYEAEDPVNVPSSNELKKAVQIFTTGCKRIQLYGDDTAGWIYDEVIGSFPDGSPVKYYNVMKMRMPAQRGSYSRRSEWQRTLRDWNRIPIIQPDIVPPENINEFITGNTIHDIWVDRKDTLDILNDDIATLFNSGISPGSDLLDSYKLLLAMAIARTDDDTIDVDTYLGYFLNLNELENAGLDIRPYLEQYGITISAYRVLRSVYDIIKTAVDESQPIDLLDLEYTDVVDILVAIHSQNILPFEAIQEEFSTDVILSGTDFQNYTHSPVQFPLTLLDEPNKWRSPNTIRKAWKDTLETRIERSKKVKEQWSDVLLDTEDITMPIMRDALIEALRNSCETFEATQERLAQMLFIETKDNCCVKHSRVSFAIETMQGFIFSLESGIYDDYLQGFSISAPNFKKEWEWIGSYATWRSAVFTYIFPENLLYPTLKRLQSPPFLELSQTIRNANRFSSDDACRSARRYQEHFEDLQHLKIICTTNSQAYFFKQDPFDCCGDMNNSQRRYTTFYFAQSELSGKSYWSEKPYYDTDETQHSFWEELPLEKNVTILGVYALARDYDENHQPQDLALWLFYTYKAEGSMKMAYLKKDLMTAGSSWSEENEIDLPDLTDLVITEQNQIPMFATPVTVSSTKVVQPNDKLIKVTACQHSVEWAFPSFIFSFKSAGGTYRHIHVRYFFTEDTFDDENLTTIIVFDKPDQLPVTGVLHDIAAIPNNKIGVTIAFNDGIQTGFFGSLHTPLDVTMPVPTNVSVILAGLFQKSNTPDHLIVVGRLNSGQVGAIDLAFSFNGSIQVSNTTSSTDSFGQHLRKIAPTFKQSHYPGGFATEAYNNEILVGTRFDINGSTLTSSHRIGLSIEKVSLVPVHSADCIEDFDLRILDIRNHIRANLSAPQGNPIGNFIRTDKVKAYLYEAYYFVPMLIALDQQQRGQFEDALAWYRSVYDYTNNINTKRKIFYGLVLEQSISNVYQRPADWLLDPLNPHLIAQTRANAYTKYTVMNITQCLLAYADREFTMDTIETVPRARKLYTEALKLLKIRELNQKPAACTNLVYACFQQDVALPSDGYWNNTFSKLQDELVKYNNIEEIEAATDALKTIFESGEMSMEEKFSSAFDYVDSHFPAPVAPESTTELMNGLADRMNNAFRFLTAGIDLHSFNASVANKVGITVGSISKLPPEDLGSPQVFEKIEWLLTPEKSNEFPFEFEFTDASGQQKLEGEFAYDPMVPNEASYQANLAYTNAAVLYEREIYSEPFTPLIDYRFCLPENPVYDAMELKVNLELYKIHNCRNIAGMVRELDIFAAPTDSTTGVPIIGASGNLILPGVGNFTPSQYRFRVLIERAKQLVSMAQQLEGQFLATLEKEDAERYSLLRARQDLQTAKSTVKLQDLRVRQANNERDLAGLQLDKVQFSFDHFEGLIDAGWNGYETASLSLLGASAAMSGVAALANFSVGFAAPAAYGQGFSSLASVFSTISGMMSQLASFERRRQEWEYQKELAGFDIQISKQQIKIAEDNIRIVGQERQISEMNAGHAEDTLEFLKTKFTNAELYRWMGNVLERSYSYMLSLATAVARTAERQYYFEQQEQAGPFILDDYWEVQETGAPTQGGGTDRRGMTGSVRLLQDIIRLDQFAFENTKRKLQLKRVISLAQLFPEEFQTFRETGVLNFELTNQFFDYDFPGQYLRLINGMKVAVIGLTPVNDGIKAMLTAGSTSYTVIEANNTFQRVPIRRLENEEIALSSPLSNNGLFELQPVQNQEFLNPFEGMGIESRWEFKMPRYSNRMDYSQVADVLVEVEYTALDNFQYRYQVLQEADNRYNFNRGFSFKNDFTDQWYELAEAQEGTAMFGVEFEISRLSFPQGLDNIRLDGSDLLLHFVREDGFTDELAIADFNVVSAEPDTEMSGETLNGTFRAVELSNLLTNQGDGTPFVKLRLYFANTAINRELFRDEKVQDILLLMSCRAELPGYPL